VLVVWLLTSDGVIRTSIRKKKRGNSKKSEATRKKSLTLSFEIRAGDILNHRTNKAT